MGNEGRKVTIEYTGALEDGTLIDSSEKQGGPVSFTCMSGQVIKGLDEAVRDMQVGETKTARLDPEVAYGAYDPKAVRHIPLDEIPLGGSLPVGQYVMIAVDGQRRPAKVASVEDGTATFDLNHPFAGKTLVYEITLRGVEDAS